MAKKLELSEITIVRILNGKTALDIEHLELILKLLGTDFFQFVQELSIATEVHLEQLTEAQEKILAKNEKLLALFYLLLRGHSLNQICHRYDFSENEAFRLALKLEEARLVEVHPNNGVKLLVSRFVQWRESGHLEQKFRTGNQERFLRDSFKGPNDFSRFVTVLLPEKSLSEFHDKFCRLLDEMKELSTLREVKDPKLNRPYTLLLAAREYVPEFIKNYSRRH